MKANDKKIKCVVAENGAIIPIHNIVQISPKNCTHCVWTAIDVVNDNIGYRISDSQYDALLKELEYIGDESIYDVPNRSTFVESQTMSTKNIVR